ncbi:hypothetical protein LCGC14_3162780, partial [marine sediment metagenome]
EYADRLTEEYAQWGGNYADHWTPYLKAHSLTKQGKIEYGIRIFDDWMSEYSMPENFKSDFWHYHFYVEFMLFYQVGSDKAIEYAQMIEDYNSSVSNKKRLAELCFLNGEISKAVDKLNEIIAMLENPKKKNEIEKLITKYSETI